MNELLQGQLVKWVSGVVLSLLAGTATCASSGCATRVTSIGEVSERPVFVLDLPGMSLKVHTIAATFENDVPAEPVGP